MKKFLVQVFAFLLLIMINCQSQAQTPKLNLDFEHIDKGMPVGWTCIGKENYKLAIDSAIVKNGNYAVSIEFEEEGSEFGAWGYILPSINEGKKITLSAYIKTENISEGYAGLWMSIDPSIAFDNMEETGVIGTSDWKRYEITLDMNPSKTKQIVIGGLLVGKGKMWVDDFKISIDSVDINDVKLIEKKGIISRKW